MCAWCAIACALSWLAWSDPAGQVEPSFVTTFAAGAAGAVSPFFSSSQREEVEKARGARRRERAGAKEEEGQEGARRAAGEEDRRTVRKAEACIAGESGWVKVEGDVAKDRRASKLDPGI
jgi:hypothetical protein